LELADVIERRWDHAFRRKVFVAPTSRHEAETTCIVAELDRRVRAAGSCIVSAATGEHRNTGGRPLAVT